MISVRHYPELVTPALRAWLRAFVTYDADGRGSCWLATIGKEAEALPAMLKGIADAVAPGRIWSGALLQCYRDGEAGTPCHTDASGTGFGFILSLGAPRTFRVHRVPSGASGCGDYDLDAALVQCIEGTVLVMDEDFQRGWHHQIVLDLGIVGEKLSLVFRTKPGG